MFLRFLLGNIMELIITNCNFFLYNFADRMFDNPDILDIVFMPKK